MDDYSKVVEAGKGHNTVVAGENPGLRQVPIHNRGEPIENGAQDAAILIGRQAGLQMWIRSLFLEARSAAHYLWKLDPDSH
jgi:hypothetical protein